MTTYLGDLRIIVLEQSNEMRYGPTSQYASLVAGQYGPAGALGTGDGVQKQLQNTGIESSNMVDRF